MNFENLLIELGTEELPPKALRKLAESFLANFTEELTTDKPFEVIISLEVGEHIPIEYEDVFIQNLVNNFMIYRVTF